MCSGKYNIYIYIQSTLDISNCQEPNKFVRDIENSTYRVVILCKLIRIGPIVLEYSRFDCIYIKNYKIYISLVKYSTDIFNTVYICKNFKPSNASSKPCNITVW